VPRILVILAAIHVAAFAWIARLSNPIQAFPFFMAGVLVATIAWLVQSIRLLRGSLPPSRRWMLLGFAGAVVARVLLLIPPTPLSDDLYRYLWDGRVSTSGINPYRFAPSSPELAHLRDADWPLINHPDIPTIYPPLAQQFFELMDRMGTSPRGARAIAAGFDLSVMALFAAIFHRRGNAALALVHGWCPLAILESAGGGHVDVLGAFFLALACLAADRARRTHSDRRPGFFAGLFLSASALVKLFPFALAPSFLVHRSSMWTWFFVLGALLPCLSFLPYLDAGPHLFDGLSAYAEHWHFNDLAFTPLVRAGVDRLDARRILAAVFLVAALITPWVTRDLLAATGVVFFAFLALSPTVHPWYGLWLVPFLAAMPAVIRPAAITLAAVLPFTHVTAWWQARTGILEEPGWNRLLVWIPVLTILVVSIGKKALRERS
jgi:hypothetical protein